MCSNGMKMMKCGGKKTIQNLVRFENHSENLIASTNPIYVIRLFSHIEYLIHIHFQYAGINNVINRRVKKKCFLYIILFRTIEFAFDMSEIN